MKNTKLLKSRRFLFIVTALCVVGCLVGCGKLISEVNRRVYPNGLTIITKPTEHNNLVAIKLMLKMGSVYEPEQRGGVDMLMMRCLKKGTKNRTQVQIAEELDRLGASIGASSGRDSGEVTLFVPRRNLEPALELFLDIIKNPIFPPAEIAKERSQQIIDIRSRHDQPMTEAFDLVQEIYYGQEHPYHRHPLGRDSTVDNLEQVELMNAYQECFQPDRMIFSIVGKVNAGQLRARLAKEFNWKNPYPFPADYDYLQNYRPPMNNNRQVNLRKSDATWMVILYPAPDILNEEYPVMSVIDTVLGGSMGSRLFEEVRDKRSLAYQIGSTYQPRLGPSIFAVYLGTANGQRELAQSTVLAEIEKISKEPVSAEELGRAKKYLHGTFILGQETLMAQADMYGEFELTGLTYRYDLRYLSLIDEVSAEDILRVARKYFGFYTIAVVEGN